MNKSRRYFLIIFVQTKIKMSYQHSRCGGAKALNTFVNCLWVGAGGMIGSVGRYLFGLLPTRAQSGFPINTLFINIIGAFCIGLAVAFFEKRGDINPQLLLFLKVGICGGFTTFSTFSLESMQLLQHGKSVLALAYIVLSVVLCLAAIIGAQEIVS